MPAENSPLRFEVDVSSGGRVEIQTPLSAGMPVTVFVVPQTSEFEDLTRAASSSLDFWDNPYDDEDWNNA
jgi:hypothetical protein